MTSRWIALAGTMALACAQPAAAQGLSSFATGPVFTRFAPVAPVEFDMEIPADAHFAVAFDVTEAADGEAINRGFETGADWDVIEGPGIDYFVFCSSRTLATPGEVGETGLHLRDAFAAGDAASVALQKAAR